MIPAIAVRRLDKRFGATRILRGVDLMVEPHERHALIGPNGAGKSTLFNLIAGAARPSAGRIELYGADITRLAPAAICRRGLARSFQTTSFFARLSVLDNLRCAAQIANRDRMHWWQRYTATREGDEHAEQVLDAVGLGERRDVIAGTCTCGWPARSLSNSTPVYPVPPTTPALVNSISLADIADARTTKPRQGGFVRRA